MTASGQASFAGTKRFQVVKQLGVGGTGAVYAAVDRENDCEVALKVLHEPNAETLLLLKHEFRSVAEIHHRNLVRLRELVEDAGRWFVTMELVDGVDALSYMRPTSAGGAHAENGSGPLDEARLRLVLPQILLGLAALHRAGKVHCDVNPSNILVTGDGRVVILDFGILRDSSRLAAERERGVEGTPAYMAPEQVLGEHVGPATDLYGAGAILYAALTGRPPFCGGTREILEAKVSRVPPPPRSVVPTVPADLDALCAALLGLDPDTRPSVDEALGQLGAKRSGSIAPVREVFVGRAAELAALAEALASTRRGSPAIVVLQGESGIGKSYIAHEFLRGALREDPELLVLEGKCYEQESVPYTGFDGIVDALTQVLAALPAGEIEPLLPEAVTLLRPLFPVIDRIAAVAGARAVTPDANPYERRQNAVRALRELFVRVARRFRVVLRIEDAHWINADTLQLLFDLLAPPGAPPLLVVFTQRPPSGSAERRLRALETLPGNVRMLHVGNLSADDTRDLVEGLLVGIGAQTRMTSQLVGAVSRDTRGHPLFIYELIVERVEGAAGAAGPVRLDDALRARVQGLPGESRAVVEIVCLAGVPLSQELLARTLGIDFGALTALVPHLRSHHLVRGSGVRRVDLIEPYHDRVREAVVGALSDERRRDLHGRLARALDGRPEVPADVLANHWEGAGDVARAGLAMVKAGDGAASAFAFEHAAELYERALARWIETDALRQSILERRGDALRNAGRGGEAADAYERAAALASRSHSLDLRRRAAEQRLTSGQFNEGRAAFRRVLAEERVRIAWTPLSSVFFGVLRRVWLRVRGIGYTPRAESEVDPRLLRRMEVLWDVLRGLCLLDASLLFDLTVRLALLALRAGEPTRVGRYLCVEAMSAAAAGELARGQSLVDTAEELTRRAGDPHTLGMHVMAQALVDFYSNRWTLVIERAETTTALFRQSHGGVAWETAVIQQFRLISMFRAGQLKELRVASEALFADAERRGDQFGMTSYAVGHPTLVYLARDLPEAGRALVGAIMQRWTRDAFLYQHYHAFVYELSAALYSGDGGAAWACVERDWKAMSRAYLLLFPEIAHEAYHLRARAALARARELPASSPARARLVRTARSDARRLRSRRVPWPRANGELSAAGVAWMTGDAGGAKHHLEVAIRIFEEETAMPVFAAAARRQLGELVGGDAGRALQDAADAALRAEDVVRPDRFAAMLIGSFAPL